MGRAHGHDMKMHPSATDLRVRWLAVCACSAISFPWTVRGLFVEFAADTPIAYLGIVPIVAVAIGAVMLGRPGEPVGPTDRQLDWIIGTPLVALGLVMGWTLPGEIGPRYWDLRLDYLGVPFLVGGLTAIVLGARAFGRVARPIILLFAAWPPPWVDAMPRLLGYAQVATVRALETLAPMVHLARPSADAESVFTITNGDKVFGLHVGSSCAGASAFAGYLVLALPLTWLLRGTRLRRIAWVVSGAVLIWLSNVLRILMIFLAGKRLGERAALDLVHPYAGLLTFTVSTALIIGALPLFELRMVARERPFVVASTEHVPRVATRTWQQRALAVVLLGCVTVAGAVENRAIPRFEKMETPLGVPRRVPLVDSLDITSPVPVVATADEGWGRRFFGGGSRWTRLVEVGSTEAEPIWIDDQVTASWSRLRIHRPLACIRWHDWRVERSETRSLAGVIPAEYIVYEDDDRVTWAMLTWSWPVLQDGTKHYERLMLQTIVAPTSEARLFAMADLILGSV